MAPDIVGEPLDLRVPLSSLIGPETVPLPVKSRILSATSRTRVLLLLRVPAPYIESVFAPISMSPPE